MLNKQDMPINIQPIFEIDSPRDSRPEATLRRNRTLSQDTLDMLIKDEFEYQLGEDNLFDALEANVDGNSVLMVSDTMSPEEMQP